MAAPLVALDVAAGVQDMQPATVPGVPSPGAYYPSDQLTGLLRIVVAGELGNASEYSAYIMSLPTQGSLNRMLSGAETPRADTSSPRSLF